MHPTTKTGGAMVMAFRRRRILPWFAATIVACRLHARNVGSGRCRRASVPGARVGSGIRSRTRAHELIGRNGARQRVKSTAMIGSKPGPDAGQPLKLAVVARTSDALSMRHIREYVVRELTELGVDSTPVAAGQRPPFDCDLLWDPAIAGTRAPRPIRGLPSSLPIVVTANGAGAFS